MTSRSDRALWPYLLVFSAALAIRLALLGTLPLSDGEAGWARQALRLAAGDANVPGSNIAYISMTASLFYVFGSSNFLARLIPALVGSLLVFLPYLYCRQLKPAPALLLSVFLAVDPGLIALSRQAGGPMLALAFLLFAWGLWNDHRYLAGFFGGLALLSGSDLWPGLLGLGFAWLLIRIMEPRRSRALTTGLTATDLAKATLPVLAVAAGTVFAIGSLFLFFPAGLTAWFSGLPEYLRGWWSASDVPAGRLLITLLGYEPLALLLGLTAIVRSWVQGQKRLQRLSLWLLVTLLLALLYPARQVGSLVWALVPLWAFAALELARHLHPPQEEHGETWGVAVLVIVILSFCWLNTLHLLNITQHTDWLSPEALPRVSFIGAAVALIVISLLLVGLGWSAATAKYGGLYGLVAVLVIYTLGVSWSATGLRSPESVELWDGSSRPVQAELLLKTVDELSEWSTGDKQAQPVVIVGMDAPALEWLLRNRTVSTENLLDPAATPSLVITRSTEPLSQPMAYRGQDFGWERTPVWDSMDLIGWLRWLFTRQMPSQTERVLLWARNDLFLDGAEQ